MEAKRRIAAEAARTGFDLIVISVTRARPPRPNALCTLTFFII
jgi:hypothetical protein